VAVLLSLGMVSSASAQTGAWRFRWEKGQELTYRIDHVTSVTSTVKGSRIQVNSKLNLVRRWRVLSVDAKGAAVVQLVLVSLRNEQRLPNGDVRLFDSAHLDKSDPDLKKELGKLIGQPLAELRVDATGKVLEAKKGEAEKFEVELPFGLVLPDVALKPGLSWERKFVATLAPPQGTGEKYPGVQTYVCKSIKDEKAVITLKTAFTKPPEGIPDQIALFQRQPEGELRFDGKAGRFLGAHLTIRKDLKNHQGADSSFHFESDYKVELVPGG
jgi:hypothetical protein